MALSNTATPIYYGQFRDAVIRGEIPVCEEISMEMNRIDRLIENPGMFYDNEAVETINFNVVSKTETKKNNDSVIGAVLIVLSLEQLFNLPSFISIVFSTA